MKQNQPKNKKHEYWKSSIGCQEEINEIFRNSVIKLVAGNRSCLKV